MAKLKYKLKNIPQNPGVYLYKNRAGEIIYVGKAKNLKKRVSSYFQKRALDPKTAALVADIRDLEYVIVSSELEAVMLENNLIKKHLPRYNVLLRDDKNWQFIKIDYEVEIPQVYAVRKVDRQGPNKYFGPYTSGLAVKNTLKLIKRVFHLCTNKKVGSRPCFQYHLGRCPGVCIGEAGLPSYRRSIGLVEQFLKNRQGPVLKQLQTEMAEAAKSRRFEKAAAARDKIFALRRIWEKQKIISPRPLSEDYLGLHRGGRAAIIKLFQVRDGRLVGQETFELKIGGPENDDEILQSFTAQYYAEATDRPKKTISLLTPPKRGNKLALLRLAEENAKDYFEKNFLGPEMTLSELKTALGLSVLPRRIECYDISNLQGTNPVGSMVVFGNGEEAKSEYRKFKIKGRTVSAEGLPKADDVGMMREMLTRRFKTDWPLPDLVVIDGGRGQLNVALRVLTAYHLRLATIGLAKRLEEIYLPGKPRPLRLPENSGALHLLQRLRDEAHRFAITFHTKRRGREQGRSRLDDIPGVGPKTKKLLLQKFGTVKTIRAASAALLAETIGPILAKRIKEA